MNTGQNRRFAVRSVAVHTHFNCNIYYRLMLASTIFGLFFICRGFNIVVYFRASKAEAMAYRANFWGIAVGHNNGKYSIFRLGVQPKRGNVVNDCNRRITFAFGFKIETPVL